MYRLGLLPADPELIRQVGIRQFAIFHDRAPRPLQHGSLEEAALSRAGINSARYGPEHNFIFFWMGVLRKFADGLSDFLAC